MIGLGETKEEIIEVMDDLLANNVDIMAIGQYLQPSKKHLKVQKYYHPDEFAELKEIAMQKGFSHCEAGPLVRSSYHADEQVNEASKNAKRKHNAKTPDHLAFLSFLFVSLSWRVSPLAFSFSETGLPCGEVFISCIVPDMMSLTSLEPEPRLL